MSIIAPNLIPPPKLTKRPWGLLVDEAIDLDLDRRLVTQEVENGPESEADGPDDVPRKVRWRDGITFAPYGCGGFEVTDIDFCEDDNLVDHLDAGECPVFPAFGIYADEQANSLDYDYDDVQGRLNDRFAVMASEQITAQFISLIAGSATILAPGVTNYSYALAAIENGLAKRLHGAQGTILVSPGTFTYLLKPHLEFIDGHYFSPGGHRIISDPGMTQLPDDPTNFSESMVGCGPIVYSIGAPMFTEQTATEYLDRTHNTITGRLLAQAVVATDLCSVVAISVAYDTTTDIPGS